MQEVVVADAAAPLTPHWRLQRLSLMTCLLLDAGGQTTDLTWFAAAVGYLRLRMPQLRPCAVAGAAVVVSA